MEIADALEVNTTLQRLTIVMRSSRARELMNKFLLRNQDLRRQARRGAANAAPNGAAPNGAAAGGAAADGAAAAPPTAPKHSLASRQVFWREEAEAIAADGAWRYGGTEEDAKETNMATVKGEGGGRPYSLTGHNATLWVRRGRLSSAAADPPAPPRPAPHCPAPHRTPGPAPFTGCGPGLPHRRQRARRRLPSAGARDRGGAARGRRRLRGQHERHESRHGQRADQRHPRPGVGRGARAQRHHHQPRTPRRDAPSPGAPDLSLGTASTSHAFVTNQHPHP